MHFQFNLFNHSEVGVRSLEDPIGILGHQLMELGHTCGWDPKSPASMVVGPGRYNVLVEGFTDYSIKAIAEAHAGGARFICLATEEPTPTGFNHGRDREMVLRQEKFPEAARYLDAIFHLVPGEHVAAWFRQFAPTAAMELGYARALIRAPDGIEPIFNFGFFGSLSKRRHKILKKLARLIGTPNAVRVEATFPNQVTRDQVMRQARVIVQIRKHEEMGLVSSSRCNTALCLGRPVVAEPHLLSKPWDEVVTFAESLDDFCNKAFLAQCAWRSVHASQFERFKVKMTSEACVGRALREVGLGERMRLSA